MRRAERVRTAKDFAAVRAARQVVNGPTLALRWAANASAFSRVGVVTGKQVGNAVIRNTVKRRLRAIMHERRARIVPGFDLVLTARSGSARLPFVALAGDVEQLLRRAHLWVSAQMASADPLERMP